MDLTAPCLLPFLDPLEYKVSCPRLDLHLCAIHMFNAVLAVTFVTSGDVFLNKNAPVIKSWIEISFACLLRAHQLRLYPAKVRGKLT